MNTLSRTLSVFALVAALALPACGGPTVYSMVGSPRSIATDGTVEVDEHENGNYMVEVELRHLPPPARLGDGLTTYVVWFIRDGVAPTLAGALDYDDAERTGTMVATTPYSQFRVRVTAEENRDVTSPSDVVVAEQLVEE